MKNMSSGYETNKKPFKTNSEGRNYRSGKIFWLCATNNFDDNKS